LVIATEWYIGKDKEWIPAFVAKAPLVWEKSARGMTEPDGNVHVGGRMVNVPPWGIYQLTPKATTLN